jgi:hypothetical protein
MDFACVGWSQKHKKTGVVLIITTIQILNLIDG